MEHLLKEALKTLCGVNQWSYAVFWKTGCQNPKLLFFEECYYEPRSYSRLAGTSENGNPDSIHLLLNKMMMDNNVLIIGEGLVGRAAFNGKHCWILPENFHRESHPPKVIEEVYQQFSAGMQAVVVIPILPHGVVQFGSHLKIVENMKFVNDVVWLILQLGNMPGVLKSKDYADHESAPRIGIPVLHGYRSSMANAILPVSGDLEPQISASFSSIVEAKNEALPAYHVRDSNLSHLKTQDWCNGAETAQALEMESSPQNHFMNSVAKAEVISTNSDTWTDQCFYSNMNMRRTAKSELDPFKKEMEQSISREGRVTQNYEHLHIDYDAVFNHPQSGDDLFDILGTDFKRKLLKSSCNGHVSKGKSPFSELQSTSQENSESGIFSSTCSDHLLDAVVFKPLTSAKQRVDDNVSSTTPRILCPSMPLSIHDHTEGDVLRIPEYLADASAMSGLASLRKGASREDSGTYSQCSSIYDSWPEYCPAVKHNSHTSTGFLAKSSMPNRKRLKPGENPRPRPKDRQMIQDRVKELREIVPNGAKCSIDALLERTIKHMLFLQSVTKHADKLKETVQSKIVGNRGGGNLGGATWAYEVGSQSMICPIVIENLNQPGQMLIEMLCHGRGLFLEIADIIRGLGLTILKGITETRNDNIWACFAVEANRDMTRMEIFLSLVGLLEQNSTEDPPQINNNHADRPSV